MSKERPGVVIFHERPFVVEIRNANGRVVAVAAVTATHPVEAVKFLAAGAGSWLRVRSARSERGDTLTALAPLLPYRWREAPTLA